MSVKDVTTLLDLIGLLVCVAAISFAVWPFSAPAAVGVAGLGLLGISWLIDRTHGKAGQ